MKTNLSAFLLSIVAFMCFAPSTLAAQSCPANTICGDAYWDGFNYINANIGDTPTAANLNASTIGVQGWSSTSGLSGDSIDGHFNPLACQVQVAGTTYPVWHPSRSLKFDNGSAPKFVRYDFPAGKTKLTISGFWFSGAAQASGNPLQDLWRVNLVSNALVEFQLNKQSYQVNSETTAGGTNHSAGITVVPQTWYFVSYSMDVGAAHTSSLALYNATTFAQVGSTVTNANTGTSTISSLLVGNDEFGVSAGTFNWFEHLVIDWSIAPTVVSPTSCDHTLPPWYGFVDPSRAINWSTAGTGTLPTRTTNCATLNPGATAAQINSAIQACTAGQTVFLNTGSYNLTTGIDFSGKSNVTLRGAGADKTLLAFTNDVSCHGQSADICIGPSPSEGNYEGAPDNVANWTAGFNAGNQVITLATVPNMHVGQPIFLDQADDTSNSILPRVCSSSAASPPCSLEGNFNNSQRDQRNQTQIVTVMGCGAITTSGAACSGTNVQVTISPGLYMGNWRASQTPQAWWATNPIFSSGVEDLSIDNSNSAGARGVRIINCQGCWATGNRSIDADKGGIEISYSNRPTVRNNYLHRTQNAVTQSYGIHAFNTSDCLIENNIIQYVAAPLMLNSDASGCVLGYNHTINNFYTNTGGAGFNSATSNDHVAAVDFVLREGNYGNQHYADNFHGTHNFQFDFRNRWVGNQPACWQSGVYPTAVFGACTSAQTPVSIAAFSRYYNFLGNVLGQTGIQTLYQSTTTRQIYTFGEGNTENSVTVPSDPFSLSTSLRWGNYDTVTVGNKFDSTEIPFGIASLPSAVPASTTLPASMYYTSKPSWWPSAKAWPPIGPDVTGGNLPGVAGHAFSIPAQDCYLNVMGGPADGTGPPLSFNAATCYSGATGSPGVFLSSTSLSFGNWPFGTSSTTLSTTLTNSGTATLNISSITSSGDFAQFNDCSSTLASSAFCTITVTFTPTVSGSRTGFITVVSNALSSPNSVSLSGTGTVNRVIGHTVGGGRIVH